MIVAPMANAAEHPEILATPADRPAIQEKLEKSPWAKESYATLKGRVDHYISLCKNDPQFMSSRLFMNWQTHYMTPLVRNSRTAGGEGQAPIPTPRFGGARDWASEYTLPARLEDYKPYNDNNGKVWLFNKDTQKEEWADPALTGRIFEIGNENIIQTAADASFIYWLTGDEKYAKYASEVLLTYIEGFSYMQPPKILGGGGEQVIGFDSFEVIHEDIVTPLAESYDFLFDYLQKQGVDVKMIQAQLKRMADRVVDGGGATGNWNLNQARIIAFAGLALEDNSDYPDSKGRQYYVDIVLNARLPAQTGITHVIHEGYDQATGVWPEAPGYSFGTTKDMVLIASLSGNAPAGQALLKEPILQRAISAQINLTYPNGYAVGLGDTVNPRVNTVALELLIADARRRGDSGQETRLTAALRREISTGNYNRMANDNLVGLTKYVGDLKEVSGAGANEQRTFFGAPLNVLIERINASDANHSLAAAMYGTEGGHVHANGLAMELYGSGLTLGADPGRGSSYWQPDHAQYYSQPPAHNTVIVNARSDYPINRSDQIAMNLEYVEPTPGQEGVSPDMGFAEASFHYNNPSADQQRTLALIRTGTQSGFYFDVFRSRAQNPANSFHDYLYHNIGQSLALNDDNGTLLPLSPTSLLTSSHGCLKGYDYFQGEKSAEISENLKGIFSAQLPDGSRHLMNFWMLGQTGRRIFSVSAPADHAIRDELPSFAVIPMPTLVVRQSGDAWAKPFVAIYEPSFGGDGKSIQSVRAAKVGRDSSLVACIVDGNSDIAGKNSAFQVLLFQDDKTNVAEKIEGLEFQGSFGSILKRDNETAELYLGHGQKIGNAQISLSTTDGSSAAASLLRDGNEWQYSATVPMNATVPFPLTRDSWTLILTDSTGRKKMDITKVKKSHDAAGNPILIAVCQLPASENGILSIKDAK